MHFLFEALIVYVALSYFVWVEKFFLSFFSRFSLAVSAHGCLCFFYCNGIPSVMFSCPVVVCDVLDDDHVVSFFWAGLTCLFQGINFVKVQEDIKL